MPRDIKGTGQTGAALGLESGLEVRAGVSVQGTKTGTLRRPRAFSLGDSVTAVWALPHGLLLSAISPAPHGVKE